MMEKSSLGSILAVVLLCVVGFLIIFIGFWCFVVFLISKVGGWGRLTEKYAAGDRASSGEVRRHVTAGMGLASYRKSLIIHQNDEGFFLDVPFLFRIGHPRLFIPWSEVSERGERVVARVKSERIVIGRPGMVNLTLPVGVLKDLRQS